MDIPGRIHSRDLYTRGHLLVQCAVGGEDPVEAAAVATVLSWSPPAPGFRERAGHWAARASRTASTRSESVAISTDCDLAFSILSPEPGEMRRYKEGGLRPAWGLTWGTGSAKDTAAHAVAYGKLVAGSDGGLSWRRHERNSHTVWNAR
jgi:hypothetical protein